MLFRSRQEAAFARVPAVVQHTGKSRFLPDAEGLFRFRNLDEAARAFSALESDYERHSRLARRLAEEHFDACHVVAQVLERALAEEPGRPFRAGSEADRAEEAAGVRGTRW